MNVAANFSCALMPVPIGGATLRQRQQTRLARLEPCDGVVDLRAPARSFLPERHRHRVHEMRAAGLVDLRPILLFLPQHVDAALRAPGTTRACACDQRAQMDGARDHVVAALAHVDVIVRMHRLAERLAREVRDHLVDVHVGAGAAARLEHVDRKLIVRVAERRCRSPRPRSPRRCPPAAGRASHWHARPQP